MTHNSFHITSSAISDRGLSEKRPQNEDSYLEMPEKGLFAVADGVGGAQAGDVASQMAVEILGEAFANLHDSGDVEELMERAISRANEAIYQMSHDLPQLSTMATTIVALHIDGNIATIGHAGDSRLYRLDSRGQLFRETQDHSVVEEEVRAGRMTPQQAENHPSKNVISRALGADRTIEVDMKTIMFDADTTFLICSDGVTRHINDEEIARLLAAPDAPVNICRQIKDICYERGAEDNLTAVIVRASGVESAFLPDVEENTVANARPPLVHSAIFAENAPAGYDEVPTQNLQMPENLRQTENVEPPFESTVNDSVQPPAPIEERKDVVATQAPRNTGAENYDVVESSSNGGFFGKLLTVLGGLIVGGLIGAGLVYYIWFAQPKTEIPTTPKAEPVDIAFSAFERNRRNVDRNPSQYVAVSGTTAEDAEDFYLLGRAYLLSGKYTEAKDSLLKAKERLPMVTGDDKAMLANEISLGLAIVDSEQSRKILEAEKTTVANAPNETNTNANTAN